MIRTIIKKIHFWHAIKVLGAAITIVLIAWSVGVFDMRGEVATADADIADFLFGAKSSTDRFAESLQRLGHEPPQIYDLNGNTIFFSSNSSKRPPKRVLEDYQREFVRVGLNKKAYVEFKGYEAEERYLTAMTGGIVPISITDRAITMGGMLTRQGARNEEELLNEIVEPKNEDELFKAHRWIEIFNEPGSEYTTVIASWSDENFEYSKMIPGANKGGDLSVDTEVPACPGCQRVHHFSDQNKDPAPQTTNIFTTTFSTDYIVNFYKQAMVSRGWEISEEQDVMSAIQEMVDFDGNFIDTVILEKDNQHLKVMIYPDANNRTNVHTVLTR